MNAKSLADKQDNICVVCCRRITIFSIGECDHPICYQCATRMRVLCKQNDCAICRKELPKMIFCNERTSFRELQDMHFTLKDSRHKLYFVDIDIQKAFYKLLEQRCQFCDNRPTYASFHSLKEHVRKEHERHFCDLCVEHLMLFTHERKCYSRADLARHRRVGDVDDKSHRGHPLCEFCDSRYLDEDELYKHLRREHFYCHFCDADGLHHYYSDYEYLREHFRQEHFLCEEGDCIHEKFTTVFRSEIDLKAHRTTVHNKNLSKAQMKQARTLELEFTIAPRSQPPRSGVFNRENKEGEVGVSGENSDHRSGYRRGYRRGEHRDDHRSKRYNDEVDSTTNSKLPEPPTNIDMNDSQAFPSLNLGPGGSTATMDSMLAANNAATLDTMAQKLAKINKFSVGKRNVNGDEEFPALGPSTSSTIGNSNFANRKSEHNSSNSKGSKSWGASTTTSVSLSTATPSGTNVTKNTLTFKLNSKEEFPGLQSNNKRMVPPSSVTFHMTHNMKPSSTNNPSTASLGINVSNMSNVKKTEERRPAAAPSNHANSVPKAKPPVVTRLTSTQNITFLDPPANSSAVSTNRKEVAAAKDSGAKNPAENADASNDMPRTESGWYVLKKGKCTKTDDPVVTVPGKDDFPALEKTKLKMRFKESSVTIPANSAWKSGTSTADSGIGPEIDEPSKTNGKKKKKSKEQPTVDDHHSSFAGSNETGKKKKKSNPSTFEKLKKLIETHSQAAMAAEDENDNDTDVKRSELKIESLPINVPVENKKNDTSKYEVDEWPAIGDQNDLKKLKPGLPPPGFQDLEKDSIKPPPGFSTNVAKPPPGFKSSLAMMPNGQSQASVTFTNSSGQDFTLSSVGDDRLKYAPLAESNERNKQLMAKIVQLLGGENDNFVRFVDTSSCFRLGDISAVSYCESCIDMMGVEQFAGIFSELLVLLPDIGKQQELLGAYNELKYKLSKGKSENSLLFLVCAFCKQVLCSKDFPSHERMHDICNQ